jgi:hypothetical protein
MKCEKAARTPVERLGLAHHASHGLGAQASWLRASLREMNDYIRTANIERLLPAFFIRVKHKLPE